MWVRERLGSFGIETQHLCALSFMCVMDERQEPRELEGMESEKGCSEIGSKPPKPCPPHSDGISQAPALAGSVYFLVNPDLKLSISQNEQRLFP